MTQLPEQFRENMKALLKEDYDQYIQSYEDIRSYGLRVNTSKISVEDFLKISPFKLTPIPWTTNGFYYEEDVRPAKHPYYYAGLYYLQEPSAMTPAQILPIESGDLVLDTCAAPGGKSTELASKLNGSGLLITNDISASRAQALVKNMELFGVNNSYVCSEDLPKLEAYFPETFDKILIDAPCSGEGMFRKEPHLISSWIERKNEYYVTIQKQIVKSALNMLKPGGMMVYSTCTFSPLEDEEIILYMKECCKNIHVVSVHSQFEKGLCLKGDTELINCLRLYPHKIKGEGHFVALLQKEGESKVTKPLKKVPSVKLDETITDFLKNVSKDFSKGHFEIRKDKLYFLPNYSFNLKGIRILLSGLYVGDIKKNHFEPSQAFAMALKMNEFKQVINLNCEDPRVIKYLKGETLDISDYKKCKGWVLVCVDGYPLGFGKASNGSLKNKYASGWRWQ